ncbi:hypothetical protein U1Q18_041523 [Sarracenia purpurea var. burkii]
MKLLCNYLTAAAIVGGSNGDSVYCLAGYCRAFGQRLPSEAAGASGVHAGLGSSYAGFGCGLFSNFAAKSVAIGEREREVNDGEEGETADSINRDSGLERENAREKGSCSGLLHENRNFHAPVHFAWEIYH